MKFMSILFISMCSVLIVGASPCAQLVVEPQSAQSEWTITSYDFLYTQGNTSTKICGHVPYNTTGSKMGMWLELTVRNAPVTLEIYAKINLTDSQGIVRPYYLTHTQYYAVGDSPVILISEVDNYYVGTYDVIEIGSVKI